MKPVTSLPCTILIIAVCCGAVIATSPRASAEDSDAATGKSILFVQNAQGIAFDKSAGTLTLKDINPMVTFFADRPYRTAGHIQLDGFLKVWEEGENSFQADPPNANLSILGNGRVTDAVVEISKPRLNGNDLTYDARVLVGTIPASGGTSSLFIDGLLGAIFSGGPVAGGLKGSAVGALIGAVSHSGPEGAAIGAAVGIIGGAVRQNREEQAAAEYAATTRVVDVPNNNGSYTPVRLHLVPGGWQGPKGEIYPSFPSLGQLEKLY